MTTVGVTGADGFFGWHLRCRLFTQGIRFRNATRETFASADLLDEFVSGCDVVVHLAGVNRADDDETIRKGNVGMAEALRDARQRTNSTVDVIYANSVKAADAGAYGESKAAAAEVLRSDASASGAQCLDIRFPHLFGEFGRPFYNSGVTTFAHQLVAGEPSTVNDGMLDLLHIQDAAQLIIDHVEAVPNDSLVPQGHQVSVPDVYATMSRLADYATGGVLPLIENDFFELRLFNTIRSQMWPDAYPFSLVRHNDHRGAFFEVVRAWGQGQTSISTTVPGITRGEHYHLDKVERFAVISGEARIRVRRLFTDDVLVFDVRGSEPCFIDMPPLCTHDITNTGDGELITLFWSHDHFDPENGDTWPLPVEGEGLAA